MKFDKVTQSTMIKIQESYPKKTGPPQLPSIRIAGTTGEFAAALGDYDENSRNNLLRASGFICSILASKDMLAEVFEGSTTELVLRSAQLAVEYLRGTTAAPDDPVIRVAKSVSPRELDWTLDHMSQTALHSLDGHLLGSYLRRLKSATGKGFVLMPVARSAVPSGLLIHGLMRSVVDKQTKLFPVYFSKNKAGHTEPKITNEEYDFLVGQSQERTLLIFDEDTHTGHTLFKIMSRLRKHGVQTADMQGITALRGGMQGKPAAFWHSSEGLLSTPLDYKISGVRS